MQSKLELDGERISIPAGQARDLAAGIFKSLGCDDQVSGRIAGHLVDTSLCGIESHGLMRVLQYAEQFQSGYMDSRAIPRLKPRRKQALEIDGNGGSGIPAMHLAYETALEKASQSGICALAIRNVGHTGRHGAYAEWAAERGCLTIMFGGGNRKNWPQVAPYGGAKGLLPTNPYCIGIPGGDQGPVISDFATSKIAGGWIYAAQSAGAQLPEGCLIDKNGVPTRDPEDYFDGGAILPAGAHKGYGLALIGELVAEAMLGPCETECHWFLIAIDTWNYREESRFRSTAEEILDEIRSCPPAPGFERVEIPGERERRSRAQSNGVIAVPERTWQQILDLASSLED